MATATCICKSPGTDAGSRRLKPWSVATSESLTNASAAQIHSCVPDVDNNNNEPIELQKARPRCLCQARDPALTNPLYSTSKYSDSDIVRLLKDEGYRSKSGFFLLRNRKPYSVPSSLPGRSQIPEPAHRVGRRRCCRTEVQWSKGRHEPVIDTKLL